MIVTVLEYGKNNEGCTVVALTSMGIQYFMRWCRGRRVPIFGGYWRRHYASHVRAVSSSTT